MNYKKFNRAEKEKALKILGAKLDIHNNYIRENDFEYIKTLSDEELIERIKFIEKGLRSIYWTNIYEKFIYAIIIIFLIPIVLGIIGLLVFGIKQIF